MKAEIISCCWGFLNPLKDTEIIAFRNHRAGCVIICTLTRFRLSEQESGLKTLNLFFSLSEELPVFKNMKLKVLHLFAGMICAAVVRISRL